MNIVTGISLTLISGLVLAKEQEDLGTIIVKDNAETIKERDQKVMTISMIKMNPIFTSEKILLNVIKELTQQMCSIVR